MKTTEPQIIISLSEYNMLIKIKDEFTKAFDDKKIILHRGAYSSFMHTSYEFQIVNETDVINLLKEKLIDYQNTNSELWNENNKLKEVKSKKWYQL